MSPTNKNITNLITYLLFYYCRCTAPTVLRIAVISMPLERVGRITVFTFFVYPLKIVKINIKTLNGPQHRFFTVPAFIVVNITFTFQV